MFRERVETLKIASVFEDQGDDDDDPVYESWLLDFLDSCSSVRTCAITDNFYQNGSLLEGLYSAYIRSLTIQRCSFEQDEFIAFFENQPLEELICEDVLLHDPTRRHWLDVLSTMLRCGRLQSLKLSNLYLNCVWFEKHCMLPGSRTLSACNAEEVNSRLERTSQIRTTQTWGYDRNISCGITEFEKQIERLGAIWFVAEE